MLFLRREEKLTVFIMTVGMTVVTVETKEKAAKEGRRA